MEKQFSRIYYLDNLRSFALLLGLIFHSAIVYAETIGYAIKNPQRSPILDDFCFFVHSFRMPLFFFLSGFFSEMILSKKGSIEYWKTRALRLLIPLITGFLLLAPIQYYITGLTKDFESNLLIFYFLYWTSSDYGLSHLWFLYYLIFYCIILPFIPGKNKFFVWKVQGSHYYLFFFVSLTFSMSLISNSFFPKGFKIFKIDLYLFIFYLSFFLSGMITWRNNAFFQDSPIGLIIKGLLFLLSCIILSIFEYYEKFDPLWKAYFWGGEYKRFIHILFSSMAAWIFIYFFIEFFKRFFNFENKITIYLRNSSLPIYLIHHPISLIIGYLLKDSVLGVYPTFFLHSIFVIILSFTIYDSLIRTSPMWQRLFGVQFKSN